MVLIVVPIVRSTVKRIGRVPGSIGAGQVCMAEGDGIAAGAADGDGGKGRLIILANGVCLNIIILRASCIIVLHCPRIRIVLHKDGGLSSPAVFVGIDISIGGITASPDVAGTGLHG